jgi:hypothetical protein
MSYLGWVKVDYCPFARDTGSPEHDRASALGVLAKPPTSSTRKRAYGDPHCMRRLRRGGSRRNGTAGGSKLGVADAGRAQQRPRQGSKRC